MRFREWVERLSLVLAVGAALTGLGFFLAAFLHINHRLNPVGDAAVGAFLLYTAFLMTRQVIAPHFEFDWWLPNIAFETIFGDMATLGAGYVAGALTIKALTSPDANAWIAFLAAPAAGLLLLSFTSPKPAKDDPEPDEIEPDSGKSNVSGALLFSAMAAMLAVIPYTFFFAVVILDFALFFILNDVLFESGGLMDVRALMLRLIVGFAPSFVALVVVIGGIGVLVTAITAFFQWLSLRGRHDANRELSASEIAFIKNAAVATDAYGKLRGYDKRDWRTTTATSLGYLLLTVILGGAGYFLFVAPVRPFQSGPGLHLYLGPDIGPSAVLFVFVCCVAIGFPPYALCYVWPYYAERSTWRGLTSKRAEYVTLKGRLTNFVRTGRLDIYGQFDPGTFLRGAGRSIAQYIFGAFIFVSAVTGWFWYHDYSRYTRFTEQGIETVDYWTLQKVYFPYTAATRVELHCSFGKNNNLDFAYDIRLPQDYSVDMLSRLRFVRAFDVYSRIDGALLRKKIRFVFPMRQPLFQPPVSDYDPACVEALAKEFSGTDAKAIGSIFHLRDWQRLHPE